MAADYAVGFPNTDGIDEAVIARGIEHKIDVIAAFFGTEWYLVTAWEYSLYFWGLMFVMLLIGSVLHVKFRRNFIDYL